jgi:hypothetical protein
MLGSHNYQENLSFMIYCFMFHFDRLKIEIYHAKEQIIKIKLH